MGVFVSGCLLSVDILSRLHPTVVFIWRDHPDGSAFNCKVNQCNSWFKKNEENKMSNAERILNTPASVVPSFIREELNGGQYTQVSTTREARSLLNAGGTTGRRTEDCPPRNSTAETW